MPSSRQPSTARRDKAARTRLRILEAAHRRFVSDGYSGTRMADVAGDAGVAVQTVYFIFHTKPELLAACYDLAVRGAPDAPPPPEQPWYAELLAAETPDEAVACFVEGHTRITARIAVLDDMVRSAVHEPEAVAVHANGARRRRHQLGQLVDHLDRRFCLREGLTPGACLDLVLTYTGPSTYRQLVVDFGWSRGDFEAWLRETLRGLLA